jgi:uncharacterized protein (TIGR00725 family)
LGSAGRPELRPIIGVIGSHEPDLAPPVRRAAIDVGSWIARAGCHLLTGGGPGVMAAAAEGFCAVERRGLSIGILPAGRPPADYPNRWVEVPIRTHLVGDEPLSLDSRNHINVRTCLALVALPGGKGTHAELVLALDPERPQGTVIAYLPAGARIGGLSGHEVAACGAVLAEQIDDVFNFLQGQLAAWKAAAGQAVSTSAP